jgi:putative membrane protein
MLKKWHLFTLLLAAQMLVQACSDADNSADDLVSESDRAFVLDAADEGLYQINAGQAAASNGGDDAIRNFGQSMIDQHTAWNQELQALAARKNIQVPTTLSDEKQEMLDTLSGQREASFDTTYIRMMVKTQGEALQLFENGMTQVSDGEIRDWINAKLPEMRLKLNRAKALNDSIQN